MTQDPIHQAMDICIQLCTYPISHRDGCPGGRWFFRGSCNCGLKALRVRLQEIMDKRGL